MFDWITWGIWAIAFFILVVFIVQPIREFRRLYQEHKQANSKDASTAENMGDDAGEAKEQ
jgi:uncharacterized membrane protein YcjF (UPF0283 family)